MPEVLARHRMTILPAQTLAGGLDTTRMPRGAGLTGWRTVGVSTRLCHAPTPPSPMQA